MKPKLAEMIGPQTCHALQRNKTLEKGSHDILENPKRAHATNQSTLFVQKYASGMKTMGCDVSSRNLDPSRKTRRMVVAYQQVLLYQA